MKDRIPDIVLAQATAAGEFIIAVSAAISPLDVARMLHRRGELGRGTFAIYVGGAIAMHWFSKWKRAHALGIDDFRMFRRLVLTRIHWILRTAANFEALGELREFARYLISPGRMRTAPAKGGNGHAST